MKQYALLDPEDSVRAMSTSVEALEDLIEGMEDEGEGWTVDRCNLSFWQRHPELNEE